MSEKGSKDLRWEQMKEKYWKKERKRKIYKSDITQSCFYLVIFVCYLISLSPILLEH